MIIKDILHEIDDIDLITDYELKMSCMTSEYTKINSESSDSGILYEDMGSLNFEIDWNHTMKTYVDELYAYSEEMEIISWDDDDGNMIEFKEVYIDNKNKFVILI